MFYSNRQSALQGARVLAMLQQTLVCLTLETPQLNFQSFLLVQKLRQIIKQLAIFITVGPGDFASTN
jgi:hypothetical protein